MIASTQLIGDVAENIGGDLVEVKFLVPPGTDPHAFEPTPQDAVRLAEADIILINGLGLEQTLQSLLEDVKSKTTAVSQGIPILSLQENGETGRDPHVWMNPQNVKTWAENIASVLEHADPQNGKAYQANAETYIADLDQLDAWAAHQIDQIPEESRRLVTDHESFGYFADHYGFEIIGVLIPSYSTLAETSAGDLADLETTILRVNAKAIFVGSSLNPSLAERVSIDTGIDLVPVYSESLSAAEGPAATYLDMIRFDVQAIVEALK